MIDQSQVDDVFLTDKYDEDGNFIGGTYKWRGNNGIVLVSREMMEIMLQSLGFQPEDSE